MSAKGGEFEREVSKLLSRWWTNGERDDVFWRTAGSGARATSRMKNRGKSTFGSHGDITAVDPIGQPLIDLFTIELKRGYPHAGFGDLWDRGKTKAPHAWETFAEQTIRSAREAGTRWWWLILKRDRKRDLIFLPASAYHSLKRVSPLRTLAPAALSRLNVRMMDRTEIPLSVYHTPLDLFLGKVTPDNIRELLQSTNNQPS